MAGKSKEDESLNMLSSLLVNEGSGSREDESLRPTGSPEDSDVAHMKARMKAMEAEIERLKSEVVVTQSRSPVSADSRRQQVPKSSATSECSGGSKKTASSERGVANSGSKKTAPSERGVANSVCKLKKSDAEQNIFTDKYSGLRIKNPLVSSGLLRQRMEGRKMVRISQLLGRSEEMEGDWVTTGVVVAKLPPKDTVKGKKFVVWRLSDLAGQSSVVGLFLFGQAYDAHWKTPQGSVVALLNARIMPTNESGSGTALSLDHAQKLMLLGTSQDFTACKARCKNGQMCSNFAKLSDGGFCDYHTHSAYNRLRSQRMEFQNGYGPSSTGSGSLRDKLFKGSKTEVFYYGGQSFAAGGNPEGSKRERTFVPGAKQALSSVGGVSAKKGVVTQQGSKLFSEMLQKQSAGARMLNQHLSNTKSTKKSEGESRAVEQSARQVLHDKVAGPKLARGFQRGDKFISLPPPSRAKLKAVAVLHSNSMQPLDEVRRESIKRRVEASTGAENSPKRQKMDEGESERIFSAKSSHDWIVQEEECQREEQYFSRLEQKEKMEEKLLKLKELKVSVVQCKQCDYIAQSPGELCLKEKHSLSRFKAVKRCFKCSGCGERCLTYGARYPAADCSKCGGSAFTQTSFYKERKGPKLVTEELLIRGREETFLH